MFKEIICLRPEFDSKLIKRKDKELVQDSNSHLVNEWQKRTRWNELNSMSTDGYDTVKLVMWGSSMDQYGGMGTENFPGLESAKCRLY